MWPDSHDSNTRQSAPPRRASHPRQLTNERGLTPCASALSSPPQPPSPRRVRHRSGLRSGSSPAGADGNGHGPRSLGGAGGLDSTYADACAANQDPCCRREEPPARPEHDAGRWALHPAREGCDRSGPPADGPELGRRPADPASGPPRQTGHGDHAVLQEDRRVAPTTLAAPPRPNVARRAAHRNRHSTVNRMTREDVPIE